MTSPPTPHTLTLLLRVIKAELKQAQRDKARLQLEKDNLGVESNKQQQRMATNLDARVKSMVDAQVMTKGWGEGGRESQGEIQGEAREEPGASMDGGGGQRGVSKAGNYDTTTNHSRPQPVTLRRWLWNENCP